MEIKKSIVSRHQMEFDMLYAQFPQYTAIKNRVVDSVLELRQDNSTRSFLGRYFYPKFCNTIYSNLGLSNGQRVLEVGTGFGFDLKNIKKRYPQCDLFGIDISKVMINSAAKNETPAVLAVALAEKLPFPTWFFDRVFSREVIEHVIDPQVFLDSVYRVLKRDGVAVITTPNGDSLAFEHVEEKIRKLFGSNFVKGSSAYKDEHMRTGQIEKIIERSGFKIKKRIFDGVLYFWQSNLPDRMGLLIPVFSRFTEFIEKMPLINRMICDQVKYVLVKEENAAEDLEVVEPEAEKIFFVCPGCESTLERETSKLLCQKCNNRYPIREGIAHFVDDEDQRKEIRSHEYREIKEHQEDAGRKRWYAGGRLKFAYNMVYPILLLALLPLGLVGFSFRFLTGKLKITQ